MNTPRPTKNHLPMVSRHSDLRKLEQCPTSWLLSHVHEGGKPSLPMILGELVHNQIQETVELGLDQASSQTNLANRVKDTVDYLSGLDVITTSRKTLDKLPNLARRYLNTWYRLVHPDSPDRLDIFKPYQWPPIVEHRYQRPGMRGTKYGQWATIDSVFTNGYSNLIVDWKTAVRDQPSDDQLNFYRFVSGLTDADALYLNLHNGTVQHAGDYPGDRKVELRIRRAENEKESMLKYMPDKKPSKLCKFCPVQDQCRDFDKREYKRTRKALIPMVDLPTTRVA